MSRVNATEVTHWAVQGERWCDVTGHVTPELAAQWESSGWRLVTRVRNYTAPIFGTLEYGKADE